MRNFFFTAAVFILVFARPVFCAASDPRTSAPLPRVEVAPDGHCLQRADGRPFFWLGDTAWQLFQDTTPDECTLYLRTRANQGFTVIQAVVLPEMDGLNRPNQLGQRPFIDNDPTRPNEAYFQRIAQVVDEAAADGLYVALVPIWGDKITAPWGEGPRIFTLDNLPVVRGYGRYLGKLFHDRTNVLWLLGGDRPPRLRGLKAQFVHEAAAKAGFSDDVDWTPIWREFAHGLAETLPAPPLTIFHPQGGEESSSVTLPDADWLRVNGLQSGHGGGHDLPVWDWIARDYAVTPVKPTLDLEPNYEDHPVNPWPRWDPATGYFRDYDVRRQTYRSVFAGGCGVTYGHHAIWQFASGRREVINHADRDWLDALWRPGGREMQFLRALVESRPWLTHVPDQQLLASANGTGAAHLQAMRDKSGSYAFVYFPQSDLTASIDLTRLHATKVRAWWYDPRTGGAHPQGEYDATHPVSFRSLSYGPDWVLVLDDVAANYGAPGLKNIGR